MKTIKGIKNKWLYCNYAIWLTLSILLIVLGLDFYLDMNNPFFMMIFLLGLLILVVTMIFLIRFIFLPNVLLWTDFEFVNIILMTGKIRIKHKDIQSVYSKSGGYHTSNRRLFLMAFFRDVEVLVIQLKNDKKIKVRLDNCEEVAKQLKTLCKIK